MTPLVIEYAERKRLAEMGFTCDLSDLPSFYADAFVKIDLKRQEILSPKKPKGK